MVNCCARSGRASFKAHAEAHSESVNGFINRAIEDEAIERDESAPMASEGQGEG